MSGDRGRIVAALLRGSWRASPAPLDLSAAAIGQVAPLLARSGAGGIAWHRLRQSPLRSAPPAREFQQHYRLQTLQAVEREAAIGVVLKRLQSVGIAPLLIKGWSAARAYPELGLRPSSDVDLCVALDQLPQATVALAAAPLPCRVDLHGHVRDLADRSWAELMGRSHSAALADGEVSLLGPEDELRLLCLHQVRHGIARPLWLCDVAARLESLPPSFDWELCLRGRKSLARWVGCVIGLAAQLLGARVADIPVQRVPEWVERAVLWSWGSSGDWRLGEYLRRPLEGLRRLRDSGLGRHHEPAIIRAAFHLGIGPDRGLPALLVQVAAFVRRKVPYLVKRLIRPRPLLNDIPLPAVPPIP